MASLGRVLRVLARVGYAAGWVMVGWVACFLSGFLASKSIGKMSVTVDTGPPAPYGATRDPYSYGGPEWAGDGCKGRPTSWGHYAAETKRSPR